MVHRMPNPTSAWIRLLLTLVLASGLCTGPGCGSEGGDGGTDAGGEVCSCAPDAACTAMEPTCAEPIPCEEGADCDDDNPCTVGSCVNSFCSFESTGADGCCTSDEDCVADHSCLEGACADWICLLDQPDPLCCEEDVDCDDLNPCTTQKCEEGQCAYGDLPGCCLLDADCDDEDLCTRDRCVNGVCLHPWWEDESICICTADASCDDGNQCTIDQCLESQCTHEQVIEAGHCCASAEDCEDGDDTTLDLCVELLCTHQHVLTCLVDAQCEDGDPCTEDLCIGGYCNVDAPPDPLCCLSDPDCDDGVECSDDRCVDGACTHTADLLKPGCCTKDELCDDGVECTQDVCAGFSCDWIPDEEGCCHDESDCPVVTKPCQEATCDDGVCGLTNQVNCCTTAGECDDGDPCTLDTCEFGQCFWYDEEGCCDTDADCVDENLCTVIACNDGTCGTPQIIENCCTNAGMCNDSDSCTIDTCGEDNECQYEIDPDCCYEDWECEGEKEVDCQVPHCINGNCLMELGAECCLSDEDCADFDPECTVDTCGDDNLCVHELADAMGCCLEDGDCVAEDPCLGGTCKPSHQCEFAPVPNCCEQDGDCDDGDEFCTADACIDYACVYTLTGEDGCCLTVDDCVPADLCDVPSCGGDHLCAFTTLSSPDCCHDDAECDDGDDCTADSCMDDACVYTPTGAEGCCEPEILAEGFEDGAEGWLLENSSGTYGWSVTNAKAVAGAMSLGYSDAWGTSYGDGNSGTALSPAMELPLQPPLSLSFAVWYSTEWSYDTLTVRLLTDAGPVILDVYEGTSGGWEQEAFDLTPWAGQTVQIEFSFSCDDSFSDKGVFIDELVVGQTCCNDDGDCDDGDPCTVDVCPGVESLCVFTPIPGCCIVDGDCGDQDPCTQDHCSDGQCIHLNNCCEADEDCDDGDDLCTEDLCVGGFCQYLPSGVPGCCAPELYLDGYEAGQGGWEFDNTDPAVGWHITSVKAAAGSYSLAFSDAAGESYGSFNSGSALSPAVDLPDQPGPTLSFKLWYQVAIGDSVSVTVVTDDGETTLAEYSGTAALWQGVTLPLSGFGGQTVRIRFDFQSGWTAGNPGVFIDEFQLFHACCDLDADCDDGNACTQDSCPGPESLCAHLLIPNCCLEAEDCDDADPCTQDLCEDSACDYVDVCCESDAECDDGDDSCTEDLCIEGACLFIPTGAPSCCNPEIHLDDFEGDLDGWSIENSSPIYGWQLTSAKAYSGVNSLAYSNSTGTDYGTSNTGTALSPPLVLPAQPGLTLTYRIWWDTEAGYDGAIATLVEGGTETQLSVYDGPSSQWKLETFDLSQWAGETVQLQFHFSCDSSISKAGIFVDDLLIAQTCCDGDEDCDDGNPCTEDSCPGVQSLCAHVPIPGCCTPDCENKECGDDGCGSQTSCGICPPGIPCSNGQCSYPCGDGACGAGEDSCDCPEDCPDDPASCSPCECGGSSSDCYCDSQCAGYGDCCNNVCEVCGFCN